MTEDEGDVLFGAEISDPVPGEDALHRHHDIFSISFDGFKKDFWIGLDIPLKDNISFLTDDAEVHGLCMKIDSSVKLVLFGVEIHTGLLC